MSVDEPRPAREPANEAFKHESLKRRLEAEIADMRPDDPLPTERALAALHGVSRMTIRRTLQELREAGLVRSVRGVGTFVSEPQITKTPALRSFSEDLRARGYRPYAELLAADALGAEVDVAMDLGVDPGTPVYRIERLRKGDDIPMCHETVHLPVEHFPGLDRLPLHGSLSEVLENRYGVRAVRARQQIRAVNVVGWQAELLGVRERSAALLVKRTALNEVGQVIECGQSVCRADLYDFSIVVTR